MEDQTQECSLCQQKKPKTEYTHRKKECKECRRTKQRQFYSKRKEQNQEVEIPTREETIIQHKKIHCECGSEMFPENLEAHMKTKTHMNKMKVVERKKERIYYLEKVDEMNKQGEPIPQWMKCKVDDPWKEIRERKKPSTKYMLQCNKCGQLYPGGDYVEKGKNPYEEHRKSEYHKMRNH